MLLRIHLLLAFVALAKGLSEVRNVTLTPVRYSESESVVVSWKPPTDLGANGANEITYGVKSCPISQSKCKSYGNITKTSVSMNNFVTDLGQIYTYHITVYGKDGTKSKEIVDLIALLKKDTCPSDKIACQVSNSCVLKTRLCDGIQNCADNSDEASYANCKPPSAPESPWIGTITETSIEIKFSQSHQSDRPTSYRIEVTDATGTLVVRRTVSHERLNNQDRTTVFEDLIPGTEYKFRIAGVNSVGQGEYSRQETFKTDGVAPATTTAAPSGKTSAPGDIPAVTNVKVVPKVFEESSAVVITWDPPASKADLVGTYIFTYCRINKDDTCKTVSETSPRKVVVNGLDKTQLYTYHIKAEGKNGETGTDFSDPFQPAKKRTCPADQFTCTKSDGCTKLEYRCNTLPDCADSSDESADGDCKVPLIAPSEVSIVQVKSTGFTVKYTQVHESERPTSYEIYVRDTATEKNLIKKQSHEKLNAQPHFAKIEGLNGDTEYAVRMRAINKIGDGKWTEEILVKTETFGPVLNVKLTPVEFKEDSAFVISFDQPIGFGTDAKFTYEVVYCRINLKDTCETTPKSSVTDVEITGLNDDDIYQWEIKIYDATNEAGKSIKDTYKTQGRRKCLSTEFRCVDSAQCIAAEKTKDYRCNTIKDCQDGSDEKTAAGCSNPTTQPESVKTQKKNEKVYEFSFDNLPGTDRITHFDVQIRNTVTDKVVVSSTKRHTILSGNVVRFQWDGVEAGNQYEIRFRGVNPAGTGPWSEPIKFGANIKTTSRTTLAGGSGGNGDKAESESGTTTAQKAGIAIGIILALIIIIIIVVIVMKNRKSSSSKDQSKYNNGASNGAKSNNGYEMDRRP